MHVARGAKANPGASLTVREAFTRYYDKTDLAPGSIKKMEHELAQWERHTDNPPIGKITDETVAEFRAAAAVGPSSDRFKQVPSAFWMMYRYSVTVASSTNLHRTWD